MATIDLNELAKTDAHGRVSKMADGLIGSEILKIAGEIRALKAAGRAVCNLTVGDFDPAYFPIPEALKDAIVDAYRADETNYPPATGMVELRQALVRFYERELGLRYPADSFMVASGARPLIYSIYRAIVDPGDIVVFPLPSWNNSYYVHLLEAEARELPCGADTRFLPTVEDIQAALTNARLVCLNSPLNPTGTAFTKDAMLGISQAIAGENREREKRGERPCYLMYDQIYWMLTAEGTTHYTPPALVPEMAKYTIFVDGISKCFAATGVRVGWAVGPTDIIAKMAALTTHVGAWAPRAEQVATAKFLDDVEAIADYEATLRANVLSRLNAIYRSFVAMKEQGLPVDALSPEGAIYLTIRIAPFGKRTPSGEVLNTNEAIRRYVLEGAGLGLVPFQAFGVRGEDGWFRMSVGAVSQQEVEDAMPRLAEALKALE